MDLIAADIGGTHARFAFARIEGNRVAFLGEATTLKVADFVSFQAAWEAFGSTSQIALPAAAAIAVASPIEGDTIRLTNNDWTLQPSQIARQLGLESCTLVNDFAAIGHAVAQAAESDFIHLCGPNEPLPQEGMIGICGPGTGLGVATVFREGETYRIFESEGGHQAFAPLDAIEDELLRRLRATYGRVSAERVVSGPGIVDIYETLAAIEGKSIARCNDGTIWALALDGHDALAMAALERFCLLLGAFAGDVALMHRARAVVIAGGLGLRLREHLLLPAFGQRFAAKGRFVEMMNLIPVKLITHPQPGLLGAAAAFARSRMIEGRHI